MKFLNQILLSGLAAVFVTSTAQATITINGVNYISPVSATTAGLGSFGDAYAFQTSALWNGSGIDAETGFATAPQDAADGFSAYAGSYYLMFDLGSAVSLDSFHIWSRSIGSVDLNGYVFNAGAGGIRNFTISTSTSNQVTTTQGVEGYVFNDPVSSLRVTDLPDVALLGNNPSSYAGQSFDLTGTARYVMISNGDASLNSWYTHRNARESFSINEVQFTTSAVPEPSSQLALLALGSAGVLTRRRIKRKASAV
ncbi:MAG: hypothetical protein RLZZ214_1194 [Verrucomicrobiota bacterium]|jgi:hypothetical protein